MITNVWKQIQQGDVASIYLLVGEEAYLIDQTLLKLKAALSVNEEVEVVTFDLEEVAVDEVLLEADTIPFFSERKLIIAKNASFLKASEKGKEKIEHDLKRLEKWLLDPFDMSVIVFIAPYEKLDERKKITKLMKEHAVLVQAESPNEKELSTWIIGQVRAHGKTIQQNVIDQLVSLVGTNMQHLYIEIEKLALYLGDIEAGEITVQLVEELVAKTLEQDAFKMLNAFLEGNKKLALEIYHDLLRQKEEPILLVGLLASNIRTMSNVYYLVKQGYHPQQIAKQLKVHPYRVKLLVENKRRPSTESLLKALYHLANVDLALKTTGGNRERHLELFLLKDF